jgi:Bacterial regulatory helix-turn-helix protein, lysR family
VAVADHGSFVKAAEQCHVAQPSLSVQLSKLEARAEECHATKTAFHRPSDLRMLTAAEALALLVQSLKRLPAPLHRLSALFLKPKVAVLASAPSSPDHAIAEPSPTGRSYRNF